MRMAAAIVALGLAGFAWGQRIAPPPVNFQPQLKAPAAPQAAKAAAARSAPKTAAAPLDASRANRIPGQQFTPAAATSADFSPERAGHDVKVGDFYFRRQDYAGALSRYQGALRHQPGLPVALWGAGRAAYRLREFSSARHYLESYIAAVPRGPHAGAARKLLKKMDR